MAKSSKVSQIAKDTTEKILDLAGISANVSIEEDSEDSIKVNIDGDDLGILIGFHGETLKSLQILLGVLINRESKKEEDDTWYRVTIDVAGWRQSRQNSLEEMAQRAAIKARETGSSVSLPPMSPDERRLVHIYLQAEEGITTGSEGEREDRHIVVSPAPLKG